VSKGDSLYSIAKKNGLLKADLAAANHLKTTAALHVGQKLVIPAKPGQPTAESPAAEPAPAAKAPDQAPSDKGAVAEATKHTVRPGETLGAIARKYGVKQGDIAVANNITDPRKIQPGQELVIPAHAASSKQAKGQKDAAAAAKSAPAADQDLDAGLKPPSAAEVPVVKIDDAPAGQSPKNP
jgi:LysM repeat protein